MSKVKARITVINSEEEIINEVDAIFQDEILKYKENNNTIVLFSYKDYSLTRENNELRMEYVFDEQKKTIGSLYIKEINKRINIGIETYGIKKKNNNIEIDFNVEDNKFKYKVEVIK